MIIDNVTKMKERFHLQKIFLSKTSDCYLLNTITCETPYNTTYRLKQNLGMLTFLIHDIIKQCISGIKTQRNI